MEQGFVTYLDAVWTWEEDLWEWGGAAAVFGNSLSWHKLKNLSVFKESGLPESRHDDKLEKSCHSEDFIYFENRENRAFWGRE